MQDLSSGHPRQFWVECERQLFSISAMDPEQYKLIVSAIRAMSDLLIGYKTTEALTAAWSEADALYARAAEVSNFDPASLPQAKISGAAFAMRERKILDETQAFKFSSAVTQARESGEEWAILSESGDLSHGLLDPYGCTEMHLRTGLAVVTMTQPEPSGAGIIYALSVVRLDQKTGQLVDAEPGLSDWSDYSSVDELLTARQALRARICENQS